jgi:hypothetical protein
MDGISVNRKNIDFFMVMADSFSNKRSSTSYMSKE